MEVRFYQLAATSLEAALPQLLTKVLERGLRAVVEAGSRERVEMLDQHLWTFSDAAFLPHGTAADGHAEEQPVFLTDAPITPNGANVRVFVDGARPDILDETGLEMVLVLFSSSDPEGLQSARALWRSCKEKGRAAVYFTQGEGRGWTETARLQTAEPA